MRSAYVACLEDILTLYALPPNPDEPIVCLDEFPFALTDYGHDPIPASPDQIRREDYEYTRHGSCSLFGVFAPHQGWRRITVMARRTKHEFALVLQQLVADFPEATTIHLVLDNLNTHSKAALYDTFPPEAARRIAERLQFHCTPIHGSWVNMQEIEWSVVARQCLNRRLPDIATVQQEVDAWASERNAARATVHWRLTLIDARRCLRRLYPVPSLDMPIPLDLPVNMASPL